MTMDDERHVAIMNILRQRCSLMHPPRLSSIRPQRALILHFLIRGNTRCIKCKRAFTVFDVPSEIQETSRDASGGSTNLGGKLNPRLGQPAGFTPVRRELPTNVYRWDPSGKLEVVVTEEQVPDPNGILLSPDQKKPSHQHGQRAGRHWSRR
jgi:hypothetical protein